MLAISVVGTGYVGLSTAVCFAARGYNVIASTYDADKIRLINDKVSPFYEPMLTELLTRGIESGNLKVVYGREEAILNTDVSFVTVGTPELVGGSIDLTFVKKACEEIGRALKKKDEYHLVAIKSTVTPGTTNGVVKPMLEAESGKAPGRDFALCMTPEFLRQGSSIYDTFNPDRVIIGEYDETSGDMLHSLFQEFYRYNVPIVRMNLASAEMVKYASNAFLATKISFANELASVCEKLGDIDVTHVMAGVGLDNRINPKFLNAGAGFGGSCLPKDVKALVSMAKALGYEAPLLRSVLDVNEAQALHVADLAMSILGRVRGKKVALLGLSFKPDTDDIREAPSLKIARRLMDNGAIVCAFDPVVTHITRPNFDDLICASSVEECLREAHCCILVTEWEQFKHLEPEDFIKNMSEPVLIDARRVYDTKKFVHKLHFFGVGLPISRATKVS
jgi:UDPglucose 6-dehydrogenase